MKLIIELSENDYKALKEDGVQNHIALADTIIAHSMPYDPQGDLISREALKKAIKQNATIFGGVMTIGKEDAKILKLIDNAPTVEAYTPDQVKDLVDLNKKLSEERSQWCRDAERRCEMGNDLISREALKIYARKVLWEQNPTNFTLIKLFDNIIDNASTVNTNKIEFKAYNDGFKDGVEQGIKLEKRPQGEWIEKVERRGCFAGDKTVYSYTCPFCGVKEFKKYPFCHCGADMRKGGAE